MKAVVIILRIISLVSTMPVIFIFFYFMMKAVGSEDTGMKLYLHYVYPLLVLLIPVAFNLTSRLLDRKKG